MAKGVPTPSLLQKCSGSELVWLQRWLIDQKCNNRLQLYPPLISEVCFCDLSKAFDRADNKIPCQSSEGFVLKILFLSGFSPYLPYQKPFEEVTNYV